MLISGRTDFAVPPLLVVFLVLNLLPSVLWMVRGFTSLRLEVSCMNTMQKEAIQQMRKEGQSYTKIAEFLGVSENTVKSYCRRNHLGGIAKHISESNGTNCRQCGAPLKQIAGKRQKQYCSDQCRMAWWNSHPELKNRKINRKFSCQICGQEFDGYGNRERRFCSRACYGRSKVVRE